MKFALLVVGIMLLAGCATQIEEENNTQDEVPENTETEEIKEPPKEDTLSPLVTELKSELLKWGVYFGTVENDYYGENVAVINGQKKTCWRF